MQGLIGLVVGVAFGVLLRVFEDHFDERVKLLRKITDSKTGRVIFIEDAPENVVEKEKKEGEPHV